MEYNKINNLLGSQSENLSKFVTRQYVRDNSLSITYNENKSIRFKAPMLRSDLCDYSDAYILINGTITVTADAGANNIRDKKNRPLIKVRKKIELAIPLKYLGNFWRALNMPLISCEVSLELKWDKNCVITSQ